MTEYAEKYVLGVHGGFAGSSVLMSRDGVSFAIAEERLSRRKNDSSFEKSLNYVLKSANVDLRDVAKVFIDDEKVADYLRFCGYDGEITLQKNDAVNFAAAAFKASGFDKALVAVNDFSGLYFFGADRAELSLLEKAETTVARQYETITYSLGFDGAGEVGKTMALAACDGVCGADKAFAVQRCFEEDTVSAVLKAVEKYGYAKIAMGGPMALNCIANGCLLEMMKGFADDLFVLPCAGADGLALGLAYCACDFDAERLQTVYWGREYADDAKLLNLRLGEDKSFEKIAEGDDVFEAAARLIYNGKIVGLFHGRSEFGPRALGNRSILAAPTMSCRAKENLDDVKSREVFRPYAPSVSEECAGDFFEMCGVKQSPFMLFGLKAKNEKLSLVQSVCHVDGTSRVQTVNKDQNSVYYRFIKEYAKLSGVEMLLNTSFNRAKEPIVETPEDALRCFSESKIDAFVLQDTLWLKDKL